METEQIVGHIERLSKAAKDAKTLPAIRGVSAQITEFLKTAGPRSSFLEAAQQSYGSVESWRENLIEVLSAFRSHIEAGLSGQISPKRQAQIEIVSDFLEQSRILLETKGVHPATPIVLAGATLEEFLRNWVESDDLSLGSRKPSIDAYAQVLVAEEKISKQDHKDIIAWAGLRNHAAHGDWAEVSERQRAAIMLEGINLFMRKYAK
jgi:hypothetical protein